MDESSDTPFGTEDDLGDDSSLWLRPIRMLLEQGKPPGQVTMVSFGPTPDGNLPFGAFTQTEKNRLVFWPILPTRCQVVDEKGVLRDLDHVTLEFPSRKMHVTWFESDGRRGHRSSAWRLHDFDDVGLAFWMKLLIRRSVLENQDKLLQRRVKSPTSDVERRKAEFTRYVQNIKLQTILLPPGEPEGDYVFTVIFLRLDQREEVQLSEKHVLPSGSVDDVVEGWANGTIFAVQRTMFPVIETEMFIATACPPGRLKQDVVIGFPRTTT